MIHQVEKREGRYTCTSIDVSEEQWFSLLGRNKLFTERSLSAIMLLYNQPEHKGSCFDIELKYYLGKQRNNGIIVGLAKRVCKELGVGIVGTDGSPTYWPVLMSVGENVHNENGRHFEWQKRRELVAALDRYTFQREEQTKVDSKTSDLESFVKVPCSKSKGRRIMVFSTRYERKRENRQAAIRYHGTTCMACGFDFEETYGEIGRGYIEVHHMVPLSVTERKTSIDPCKEMVCLCANCHRMIHWKRNAVLSLDELRALLKH